MKAIATITAIALFATANAYAESSPASTSSDPLVILKEAYKNEADIPWVAHIRNLQALGEYQAAKAAGEWCGIRGKSTDDTTDACGFYVLSASAAENAVKYNITQTRFVLMYLKSNPKAPYGDYHRTRLKAELSQLESLPTPVSDLIESKLKKASE